MAQPDTTGVLGGFLLRKFHTDGVMREDSSNGLSWKVYFKPVLASYDSFTKIDLCGYVWYHFKWDEAALKEEGYDGFKGSITAYYSNQDTPANRLPCNFELTHSGQWIQRRLKIETTNTEGTRRSTHLSTVFHVRKFSFQSTRVASQFNDAVLVVEGNKINVNKSLLSIHSEYFNVLFNSNFKEKSMTEIPIEDVKYADFIHLLDTFDPKNPIPPTDEKVENLLELADRFAIPAVTVIVENFLISNSQLQFKNFVNLADKYKLDKLWESILKPINSVQKMQMVVKNIKCERLSETARSSLFCHFADKLKFEVWNEVG